MPVIRGEPVRSDVSPEQRRDIVARLEQELNGLSVPGGPVIFEIPFQPPDAIDVLVVWDAWDPLLSEDRTDIILDVYNRVKPGLKIAQALGVTVREALDQHLLAYHLTPLMKAQPGGGIDPAEVEEVRKAMLAEGGIPRGNGDVDLYFPTRAMAEQAQRRLTAKIANSCWAIGWRG